MSNKIVQRWLTGTALFSACLISITACAPTPTAPSAQAPQATPTRAAAPQGQPRAPGSAASPTPSGAPTRSEATPAPTRVAATSSSPEAPRKGGVLLSELYQDPPHYDLQQGHNVLWVTPLRPAYDGLVQYAPPQNREIVPDLAESWSVSSDGTIFTFRIRPGVKWHDGTPLTVEDVRYSLLRMARPPKGMVSPRGQPLLQRVQDVEAVDERTIRIRLDGPSASFLSGFATDWVVIMPKRVIEIKGDMKKDVVGTGPFRFVRHVQGSVFEVTRNENYWMKDRPYLDGMRWFIIPDVNTKFAAFRTGRIDMTILSGAQAFTDAQKEIVDRELQGKASFTFFPGLTRRVVLYNHRLPLWRDPNVRKAFDIAVDRPKTMALGFGAGWYLGGALDSKGGWGTTEEPLLTVPGYRKDKTQDIAEAKALLARAGVKLPETVNLLSRNAAEYSRAAQIVKETWEKGLGVRVTFTPVDAATLYARKDTSDFDAIVDGLGAILSDPDQDLVHLTKGSPDNYGAFTDPEVEQLYKQQSMTMDVAKRKEIVRQVEKRVFDLRPYSYIGWLSLRQGWWLHVRNYSPGPGFSVGYKFRDVWLAK